MLTAVHVRTLQGAILRLPMTGVSPYVVRSITGLDPVPADIVTSSFVTMDGGVYQSAKGGMRNIVISLELSPSYKVSDPFGELRRGLYPFFAPKMEIELYFISNNFETVKIIGHVESFEAPLFSEKPKVDISILCPDPYFSSQYPVTTTRVGSGQLKVENPGTVESGFILTIDQYMSQAAYGLTVGRVTPTSQSMQYVGPLYSAGLRYTLRIITIKGSKSAKVKPSSAYDPNGEFGGDTVLGYIDGWVDLAPGENIITIDVSASGTPNAVTTLSYTPRYIGL